MDGVALCARFSIATNRLEFCGPSGAEAVLYRAITEGTDLALARDRLRRFEALLPYLELIGRKHGRDPFDLDVVRAYWIGNDLLDSFERRDFVELLELLTRRGLPRSLARRLLEHLPEHPIPHHAFHVTFVGVGNVTGHVPTTLANMDACRPGWGDVVRTDGATLTLRCRPLEIVGGRLALGSERTTEVRFDPRVLPGVEKGDTVALHWSTPAVALDADGARSLARYTRLSLDAANEALPGLGVL